MDSLIIEATQFTPEIRFEPSGRLIVKGRSIPENSVGFYKELYAWVDEYVQSPSNVTEVVVQLDYFNTSSAKCILDFLRRFSKLLEARKEVQVKWYYDEDDDDMLESGEDYQDLVGFDFEFIVVE